MKSVFGILVVVLLLFIYNMRVGPDVIGLAVVTLCLWHGIWRLLDHIEKVAGIDDQPLVSAIVSISAGAIMAFSMHQFRPHAAMQYLTGRF